jgi:tetratricopeptide (TPR) repeat protein
MNPPQTSPRTAFCLFLLGLACVVAQAAPPVTPADAAALSKRIEDGFAGRDPQPFIDSFDNVTVIKLALASDKVKDEQVKEMASQTLVGLGLANRIVAAARDNGSYKLVRIDESDPGHPTPLFRLLSGGSLNYHKLRLARDASGAVRIVDVDVFISGEPLSKTLRRLLIPALVAAGNGKADEYVQQLDDVGTMQRVAASGNYKMALDLWAKLPQAMRYEKAILLDRLQYAQNVGGTIYDQAFADHEKHFPNDPVLDLVRVNTFASRKRYEEALAAVDRLDQSLNDPYLNLLRGQFFFAKKDFPAARQSFEKLLKWDPKFERAWGGLLMLSLKQKDFARTAALLDEREKAVGKPLTPEVLEKTKEFAEFVQSKEYQAWKSARP